MAITKEQAQKMSVAEIENLIYDHKQKIAAERNLVTLGQLNSELGILQEIHEQKLEKSGKVIRKGAQSPGKIDLKSYDDYLNSKKK